jgi:hypothetical protein
MEDGDKSCEMLQVVFVIYAVSVSLYVLYIYTRSWPSKKVVRAERVSC